MDSKQQTDHQTQKSALLTRKECAPALHISVRKLDEMTKKRQVPCYRLGAKVLYRLDRVLAALDALEQHEVHRP